MTILRVQKVALIGLTQDKPSILDAVQSLGLMHVIPLQAAGAHTQDDALEVNPERLKRALQYLLASREKRRQVLRAPNFNLAEMLTRIDKNRSQRLEMTSRRDFLEKRIRDLEPWGDFNLPEVEALAHQKLWFYLVPNFKMREVERSGLIWTSVHQDNRYHYIVVLSATEPDANRMPVARTLTGQVPLSQLEQELEDLEIALESVEAEREALTRWIYQLQLYMASTADAADLARVAEMTWDVEDVFALQGWVAVKDIEALYDFAQQQGLVFLVEEADVDELPPTRLENAETLGGGQEVVSFFQTPNYHAWDPSRVVFFSFTAFFAIIMSDAGYALLMGGLLAYYWRRLDSSVTARRLRNLSLALVTASLVWGVAVGSYFGAEAPIAALAALKFFDLKDFDGMMALSISIGAAHLILANVMMAWVRRRSLQAYASLGWALAVLSALLGWLFSWPWITQFGLLAGVVLVLVMTEQGQVWQLRQIWRGGLALTNLTKLFGDVLSYLRLFALGLASASLAITFNQLASDVATALPGIGVFLQVLILLTGHLLNFVLTVVSGVIHGLRLNLIEFYNWSLADEGYAFQPFAKQEVTPWKT